jgi:hypothetical protein
VAAGFLALGSGLAAPVAAQEPDRSQEGTAGPEAPSDPEADAPGFDPGGDTTLPLDVAPAPSGGDDGGGLGAPLDAEPVDDPDVPAPSTDESRAPAPPGGEAPAPETEREAPDAATPPADSAQPRVAPPQPTQQPGTQRYRLQPEARPTHSSAARLTAERRAPIGLAAEPPPTAFDDAPRITGSHTTTAVEPEAKPTEVQPVVNAPAGSPAQVHVVQPGESLWAIADDLLGPGASPARISREVQRLWSLNEARIGTGDPDLLMVGTELRLR